MKKIYLMGLTSLFALAVNAQTTLKVNKPLQIGKNSIQSETNAAKKGGPNPSPMAIAANIVCNSTYMAGTTQDVDMVLTLTNTNPEFGDGLTITFPAGITVNSTTNTPVLGPDDGVSSSDGPEAFNGITGQTISWGNDDNYYGGIVPAGFTGGPGSYPIRINITIPITQTGPIVCNFHVDGDEFNTPADFDGTFNINDASAPNMMTKIVAVITNTVTFASAEPTNCSMGMHIVAAQIHNAGGTAQSNIPVNYSVNGIASVVSTYTGSINPGDSAVVVFPVPFDFSAQNIYKLKAWTAMPLDASMANDTATFTFVNSVPVALTSTTYTNGIQTAYDYASITQSWAGAGLAFSNQTTHAHTGGVAMFYTINNTTMGPVPNGTYETMNILPCMDVTIGDTYRISFWKKAATAGTVTVNGETGVFTGLVNDIASMTTTLLPYTALTPTSVPGSAGWVKDSVDYVATATETRYFAIGGRGTLSAPNQQINVRLDDIMIAKVTSGVGIKTNTANDAISIFPNPTFGILNINAIEVNSSIEVYNVIGDKVYSSSLTKGNNTLDLSGLANGAYFVKLNSNNQITTKKVVLTK